MWHFLLAFCLFVADVAPAVSAPAAAGRARVVDGDTIVVAGERIRLFGVDAPESGQTCRRASGEDWPCGQAATRALSDMIGGRKVVCEGRDRDRYGRLVATCSVGGADLAQAMAAQGMAFAYRRYSLRYVPAEQAARRARLGVWQGAAEDPARLRAARTAASGQVAPDPACAIKGNVSSHGRIYHLPGQRDYAATRVDSARGERWFCSEAQARAQGWRRARD